MDSTSEEDGELYQRITQQEVVAELGQQALKTDDISQLLHDASVAVAETLNIEYTAVLELLPDGDALFLREGVGWHDKHIGSTTIPTDLDSQAGYTLISEQPIIVDDLCTEERFCGSEFLTNHDVSSGISVIIGSVENPWGILGVHTSEQREFSDHNVTFVQSIANVLATAIENERTKRELEEIYGRISDAFFALNKDWEFTHLNERAHTLINPEHRELVGKNIWDAFPKAVSRKFKPQYARAMYEQETVSFEEYYPDPLNSWFEVRAYPSETGLSVYFRDITERKDREQELELFRTLLDRTNDSVLVVDPQTGRFLDVNKTACRRLGYDRDELLELSVIDIERTFSDIAAWKSHVEELKTEGTVTVDGEHERKDGTTYPAETNVTHVELNREYMVAISRDVTERQERERALEESERRYRTLVDHFPNGAVGLYNKELSYIVAGGELFDELGIPLEDVVESSIYERYPDDLVDELEPHFQAVFDGESNVFEVEYHGRDLIGHTVPVYDANDEIHSGMVMVQDITDRKEYERKLEESNERLEQFAYAASHDLQEPLRMVSSYLRLIENRYSDALDEDGEEFLEFAIDGADRMRDMIAGLLEYSRVETRGDPFDTVDLNTVVDDVLADLQFQIDGSNAEITTESLPRVEGDEGQLRQVFQNLLSNAIEYSGDEPPRIHIDAERTGSTWTVSVRDEGIGIDPADQDRVFEVFQRLHNYDEHAGTGIGLALCRRIIERHGGTIWVDSEPGENTTFSFTLQSARTHD